MRCLIPLWLGLLLSSFTLGNQSELTDTELNFTVYTSGEYVNIHWTASPRSLIAGFTVERSRDGKDFSQLKFIEDQSASPETAEFLEADTDPLLGWSYYRIKQHGLDGKEFHTHIVPVFYGLNRIKRGSVITPEELGSSETRSIQLEEFAGKEAVFVLRNGKGSEFYYECKIAVDQDVVILPETDALPSGLYTVTACSKDPLVGIQITVK